VGDLVICDEVETRGGVVTIPEPAEWNRPEFELQRSVDSFSVDCRQPSRPGRGD